MSERVRSWLAYYYDSRLTRELCRQYRGLPVLGAFLVILLAAMFHSQVGTVALYGWLGLMLLAELALEISTRYRGPELPSSRAASWLKLFVPLHLLVSLGWGCGALLFLGALNLWQEILLMTLLFCLVMVPLPVVALYFPAFLAGALLTVLPGISYLLTYGVWEWRLAAMGLLMVGVLAVLIARARDTARARLRGEQANASLSLALRSASAAEQEVQSLQRIDSLTGLPNTLALKETLARIGDDKRRTLILVCNVLEHKQIVAAFGMPAWEGVSVSLSQRLPGLPGQHYVARLDDSAFVLLCDPDDGDSELQILPGVFGTEVFEYGEQRIPFHLGVGLSCYPDDAPEPLVVLENAVMMANSIGVNDARRAIRYHPELRNSINSEALMATELASAIRRGELQLHFQPKVELRDGAFIGAEVLLRWHNQIFGQVSPAQFIPLAEKTSLILEIGCWILEQVVTDVASLSYNRPYGIAVNVSVKQLGAIGFLNTLKRCRDRLPKHVTLEVEITESVVMEDPDAVQRLLESIRRLGVRVALDDFGTGYSSLSYLSSLPVDQVKLDKQFIDQVHTHSRQAVIVDAVLNMAHGIGHQVVAEGIENEQQIQWLRQHQCRYGQGYYFAKPMPVTALGQWLARRAHQKHPAVADVVA